MVVKHWRSGFVWGCLVVREVRDGLGVLVLPLRPETTQVGPELLDTVDSMLGVVDLRLHTGRVQFHEADMVRLQPPS